MMFEARKTKFTIFSLNHELYNLIKTASNMNFKHSAWCQYLSCWPEATQINLFRTSESQICLLLSQAEKT